MLENKYSLWYFNIVDSIKNQYRSQNKENIFEKHHILLKSLGGLDTSSNLILVTSREHFLCHWLLTKMTEGQERVKMNYAFWLMCNMTSRVSSCVYEKQRKIQAELVSKQFKGRTPVWLIGSTPWNKGKKLSEAHRKKLRLNHKGMSGKKQRQVSCILCRRHTTVNVLPKHKCSAVNNTF